MATSSHRTHQVSFKPNSLIFHIMFACYIATLCPFVYLPHLVNTKNHTLQKIREQSENVILRQTLRFKIGREATWLPTNRKQNYQANILPTQSWAVTLPVQEHDQDMADSSSPQNNKRAQLQIQLPIQQKKKEATSNQSKPDMQIKTYG